MLVLGFFFFFFFFKRRLTAALPNEKSRWPIPPANRGHNPPSAGPPNAKPRGMRRGDFMIERHADQ